MAGNRSQAVMAQRHEAHDSLDDFPTPPWATRALIEQLALISPRAGLRNSSVLEPACNRGFMVKPLRESFGTVIASDVRCYGHGFAVEDFLFPKPGQGRDVDWIITNPPFRLARESALVGLERARAGVALFLRLSWLEGAERYATLFRPHPPHYVLPFAERVVLYRGRVVDPDVPLPETGKKPTSATAYAWFLWLNPSDRDRAGCDPRIRLIPPCRPRLQRPGDYQLSAEAA